MKGIRNTTLTAACLVGLALILAPPPAAADQVFLDDVIVDGSLCVGFDCVNGESFGFDTIRLKENNLRIHFDDTSTASSYPRNDWRIVINSSANGGGSFFGVEDAAAGQLPFQIEAGARANSLYIDDGGRLGLRTSTPSVEIHTIDGDTPTLRLQQDGSSGFAPQTWDVAGNETNFFIRDVTNGSLLPLRIRPEAPGNSLFMDVDGDIGFGTSSPSDEIHVRRTSGNARMILETTAASQAAVRMINSVREWRFQNAGGGDFTIETIPAGPNGDQLVMDNSGNMTLSGSISTSDCTPCVSDYVFEPDYELMPLAELEEFVWREGHLPNVPSQGDVDKAGKLNMTEMQMRMLEKIEELVLYTIEQEKTINRLTERLEAIEAKPE